jgi:hypothetical protein
VRVCASRPRLTIGRQPFNDLVVDDARVSRVHVRVELRGACFVLCDESSNGTCLFRSGAGTAVLRRDERELGAAGLIGLGGSPRPGEAHTLEYRVEQAPGTAGEGP